MMFQKYHSLGNDFILVDQAPTLSADLLCDRHRGVGADGILIISRHSPVPKIRLINSDGSFAEKCYNGLRCAAWYLYKEHHFPSAFQIEMSEHLIHIEIQDDLVITNVGEPRYCSEKTIQIQGKPLRGHVVDVGNPHFVICQAIDLARLQEIGPLVEKHPIFPHKTNVEFVFGGTNNHFDLLTYERGCGVTQACGTGCAAVIKTLHQLGRIQVNEEITLKQLGGELKTLINQSHQIIQKAPATYIFSGEY